MDAEQEYELIYEKISDLVTELRKNHDITIIIDIMKDYITNKENEILEGS